MGLGLATRAITWLQQLDGRMVWRMDDPEVLRRKQVYLTFDDGPLPVLTPWVLDTLKELGVKATFFCIGKNVQDNPDIFQRLKAEGHAIGNHTWDHPNGWKTSAFSYYRTALKCQPFTGTDMFRPPYGRMTNRQINALRRRFRLMMWDVLAGDFDQSLSGDACVQGVLRRTRPGSILVFHDNMISERNMRYAMPIVVRELLKKGYSFNTLPNKPLKN